MLVDFHIFFAFIVSKSFAYIFILLENCIKQRTHKNNANGRNTKISNQQLCLAKRDMTPFHKSNWLSIFSLDYSS